MILSFTPQEEFATLIEQVEKQEKQEKEQQQQQEETRETEKQVKIEQEEIREMERIEKEKQAKIEQEKETEKQQEKEKEQQGETEKEKEKEQQGETIRLLKESEIQKSHQKSLHQKSFSISDSHVSNDISLIFPSSPSPLPSSPSPLPSSPSPFFNVFTDIIIVKEKREKEEKRKTKEMKKEMDKSLTQIKAIKNKRQSIKNENEKLEHERQSIINEMNAVIDTDSTVTPITADSTIDSVIKTPSLTLTGKKDQDQDQDQDESESPTAMTSPSKEIIKEKEKEIETENITFVSPSPSPSPSTTTSTTTLPIHSSMKWHSKESFSPLSFSLSVYPFFQVFHHMNMTKLKTRQKVIDKLIQSNKIKFKSLGKRIITLIKSANAMKQTTDIEKNINKNKKDIQKNKQQHVDTFKGKSIRVTTTKRDRRKRKRNIKSSMRHSRKKARKEKRMKGMKEKRMKGITIPYSKTDKKMERNHENILDIGKSLPSSLSLPSLSKSNQDRIKKKKNVKKIDTIIKEKGKKEKKRQRQQKQRERQREKQRQEHRELANIIMSGRFDIDKHIKIPRLERNDIFLKKRSTLSSLPLSLSKSSKSSSSLPGLFKLDLKKIASESELVLVVIHPENHGKHGIKVTGNNDKSSLSFYIDFNNINNLINTIAIDDNYNSNDSNSIMMTSTTSSANSSTNTSTSGSKERRKRINILMRIIKSKKRIAYRVIRDDLITKNLTDKRTLSLPSFTKLEALRIKRLLLLSSLTMRRV